MKITHQEKKKTFKNFYRTMHNVNYLLVEEGFLRNCLIVIKKMNHSKSYQTIVNYLKNLEYEYDQW